MDSNIPGTPPTPSVLPTEATNKGRRAKRITEKKYWGGTAFFWLGIAIAISGSLLSVSVGGNFARVCYLLGLALFIIGALIEVTVIIIRLVRER